MAVRTEITSRAQLQDQEGWIFSVNGKKAKLYSLGLHEALFTILMQSATEGDALSPINLDLIDDPNNNVHIYKIGEFKKGQKGLPRKQKKEQKRIIEDSGTFKIKL
jgi:hypothetical protein